MNSKTRTPNPRSSLAAPRSVNAAAIGVQIGTMVVSAINTRTTYQDRRHQREVILAGAMEQARLWDAEAARLHCAFHETLELATVLAKSGHVEQALEALSRAAALLPPTKSGPPMLNTLASMEVP